jgi:ATP-dependent Lhr-like helicase
VILQAGELLAYLERGGRSLLTFATDPGQLDAVAAGLAALVDDRRVERLQLSRIDGDPPVDQPVLEHLRAAGFVDHPRGLVRRRAATAVGA